MLDFLRNLTKTAGEKQQELLNAYLDDALRPRQRQRFERQLAQDAELQQNLDQQRLLKEQLRQLPRRRVPRNFTLDPAIYGRPQREPLLQLYPALRLATVLTAFFFVLAIGLGTFSAQLAQPSMAPAAADLAMTAEEAAQEAPAAEVAQGAAAEFVEVTRVVTEEVAVEESEPVEVEAVTETEEVVVETEEAAEAEADQAAEISEEVEIPAEPAAAAPITDTAAAEESMTAPAEREAEPAAGFASTPSPLPTSAATETSIAPTATVSAVPRSTLQIEGGESDRSLGASLATAEASEDVEAIVMVTPIATMPSAAEPAVLPPGLSGLQWLQLGLGAVFILLATITLIARRRFR